MAGELTMHVPGASPHEAAAAIAAVQQFLRDRAPVHSAPVAAPPPWLQAALRDGVSRAPDLTPAWA